MNLLDWIVIAWLAVAFVVGVRIGRIIPLFKLWFGLLGGVVMAIVNVVILSRLLAFILQLQPDHNIELMIQQSKIGSWLVLAGSWLYGYIS